MCLKRNAASLLEACVCPIITIRLLKYLSCSDRQQLFFPCFLDANNKFLYDYTLKPHKHDVVCRRARP